MVMSMGGERLDTRNPTSKLMLTILAASRRGSARSCWSASARHRQGEGRRQVQKGARAQATEGRVGSRGDREASRRRRRLSLVRRGSFSGPRRMRDRAWQRSRPLSRHHRPLPEAPRRHRGVRRPTRHRTCLISDKQLAVCQDAATAQASSGAALWSSNLGRRFSSCRVRRLDACSWSLALKRPAAAGPPIWPATQRQSQSP